MQFLKITLLLTASSSMLLANIGEVTALRGDVKITRGIALYQAHKALKIEEKDTFFTSKNGSMQITFKDNTVVTLGKNTVFKVDEYLYSEKNKEKNSAKFKFRKGFFKSITGRIGKLAPKKFAIKTKNSTIGVRGTEITGSSNNTVENIVCTHGEIVVKSGSNNKEYIAVANEHVKIKLDPRVNYIIAKPTDLLIQEQIKEGIKKEDDPELKRYVTKEISVEFKPEVKKEMIKQGIKIDKKAPIVVKDVVEAAVVIKKKESTTIEDNFLIEKSPDFKSQEELREEINSISEEDIAKRAAAEEEARIDKAEQERLFRIAEKKRVNKLQESLEAKRNLYNPTLPEEVPEDKVESKKDVFNKKIKQMDGLLNNSESTF
jgi:hypothetical protein